MWLATGMQGPPAADGPALAQPDFSGEWVLEPEAPSTADVARALSIHQSIARTNIRGEPIRPFFKEVSVTRRFSSGPQSEGYLIGVRGGSYLIGVRGGSGPVPKTRYGVFWENQTLVLERGSDVSGQWIERRETWSFDPAGRLLVTITTGPPTGPWNTVTLLYRRQ